MSIFIVYGLSYSGGNPYTGFKFVEVFGDFLGDRLCNIDIVAGDIKVHAKNVKDSKNLAF